jgi:hypothetical protein
MRLSAGRWSALGGALLTVGSLLAVSFWIFALQSKGSVAIWQWPEYVGLGASAAGFLLLVVGVLLPSQPSGSRQSQSGGAQSINVQAGRDIDIHGRK